MHLRHKQPANKDPFLPLSQNKSPFMPLGPLPDIEDEQEDIDAILPNLYTDFEENVPHFEGIIHEVYERTGEEYLQQSPELQTQIGSKGNNTVICT